MITIHAPNSSDFSTNGLGVLEPLSCVLNVSINGAWSLELEHPFDEDEKYKKVEKNNIIKVDNVPIIREQTNTYQLFRIYDVVRTLSTVRAIAFPVAFEATYDAIIEELNITKKSATAALQDIMTYLSAHGVSKYTVTSDYTQEGVTIRQKKGKWASTNLIAAISGSDDGSIINKWGGEVAYDNYHIIVNGRLGSTTDYDLRYGKNLTGLSVDVDTSGVVTRFYPVSSDNVRFKKTVNNAEVGYVQSPDHFDDYPFARSAFVQAPYKLIDTTWEVGEPHSDTQIKTHEAIEALIEDIEDVARDLWSKLNQGQEWHNKWYEPEWVQSILKDAIAQCQKDITANITHPTWKAVIQSCIKEGLSYIKDQEIPDFYWEEETVDNEKVYFYTNGQRYITNQYYYVDKRYCKFNSAGNYEPPADEPTFDWIQKKGSDSAKKFGNNKHYMAHNEDVYITMNGTLVRYYMDDEGWYDNNEDESDWTKHNWGTSSAWFGEEGATSSDTGKYAHDTWLFIDGTYYYFNSKGYVTDQKNDYKWDWVKDKEKYWFGNKLNHEYGAVYVTNQWLKIDGEWHKFKPDGTLTNMKQLKNQFVTLLSTNLATAITETIDHHQGYLYSTLYEQMEDYCEQLFEEGADVPVVNVTANLVDLSKTAEYSDIFESNNTLKSIRLGDDVMLRDFVHQIYDKKHAPNEPEYKDEVEERVVGLKYDCIKGYNTEVTISDPYKQFIIKTSGKASTKHYDTLQGGNDALGAGGSTIGLIAGENIQIDENGVIRAFGEVGDVNAGTQVSYSPSITSGTLLGTIYINGVSYGIYSNGGGTDVEVYRYLTHGTHIADIVVDNVPYALYSDGLQWWVETETDFYRTGTHEETEYDEDFFFDTVETWRNLSPSHAYYGDYDFTRANSYDAIIGNYSNGTNSYFVLASKVAHGADWLWRDANRIQPADYVTPTSGDGRYVWKGEIDYWGETWYASVGQYNFEAGDVTTTPFISFTLTGEENVPQDYVYSLLRTAIETEDVADVVGLSNQNTVFYFGTGTPQDHENVAWITKDGVFHGKGFEVDGEPVGGLSKTQLYSGTQYAQTINLSESYNGFSFILIETYNSNDKKNLSSLLSVSDLTSGSYVGIDNYLLYTITNTKKLTFHDDFDDSNHSRYIKKIYGLRSGDDEGGGSDNAVLDVTVNGNSVVANRVASIDLTGKQDTLIAGTNISIGQDGKTISATDTDEISELDDVSLSNLANGQILKYNSTSQKWENANESGGGATDLDDLTDVDITTPSNGQILKYNNSTSKWENANESQGTTVIANPSGTATADLNKLQVGSTIYGIPSTEVVANPSGTPTNDLNTIEIGSTIYNVAGGGGGSTVETNMIDQPYGMYWNDGETITRNNDHTEMYFNTPNNASQPRGIVVWKNAIPSGVKRIKYKMDVTAHNTPYLPPDPAEYTKIIIGIKSTYQSPLNVSATDVDWIDVKYFDTIGTIEGEFEISTTQNFYLYILANSWCLDLLEFKTVEYIGGGGASELTDLSDTDISSPTNGQILKFNSTSQKWENGSAPSGGRFVQLASPPSATGYFPIGNISLSEDMANFDVLMFTVCYANQPSVGLPPAMYPVSLIKTLTYIYLDYNALGYGDVAYVDDTTINFSRDGGITLLGIYGIKY